MKHQVIIAAVLVSVTISALSGAPAPAQQSRGGAFADRLRQLDRDGDGKVSREEGGSLPFFDAAEGLTPAAGPESPISDD